MAESKFVKLFLSCEDRAEAEKIAEALLEQRLVACVRFTATDSRYWWKGKLAESQEIVLSMASFAAKFDKIEAEVTKLHSYDTFVLQQVPIERLSKKAQVWIEEELSQG